MNNNNKPVSSGRKYTKNEICEMLIADCDLNKKKRNPNYVYRAVNNQNTNNVDHRDRELEAEKKENELYEAYRLDQEKYEELEHQKRLDEIHSKYGYHSDVYNEGDLDEMERRARNDDIQMWY